MSYQVIVLPKARDEMYRDALWWSEHRSADQAARWLAGFEDAINNLANDADTHPLARENGNFSFELRQKTFGLGPKPTHRAIFEISGDKVLVHGVRHLARRDIGPDDL